MPQTGAFVLAPNHYSEIDPLVMGVVVLEARPRAAVPREGVAVQDAGARLAAAHVGPDPGRARGQQRATRRSRAAEDSSTKGRMVVVYPEGSLTRDPDLWPMRGKTGAVRIALERGIPIIPAAHWGTQALLPRYGKKLSLFPRKTIDVIIGDPVDLERLPRQAARPGAARRGDRVLMDAITALLAELRGEQAPAERWDPAKHGQKETGRLRWLGPSATTAPASASPCSAPAAGARPSRRSSPTAAPTS